MKWKVSIWSIQSSNYAWAKICIHWKRVLLASPKYWGGSRGVYDKRSTCQCKCDEHTFVNRTLSIFIEHQSCAEQYYSCKALYNWELDNIPTWQIKRTEAQIEWHTPGHRVSNSLSSYWKHSMTPGFPRPPADCLVGVAPEIFIFEKLLWRFLMTSPVLGTSAPHQTSPLSLSPALPLSSLLHVG